MQEEGGIISQTISILEYLTAVLDEHKAPEVADNLQGLYRYMVTTLLNANINNDDIDDARLALDRLCSPWRSVISDSSQPWIRW